MAGVIVLSDIASASDTDILQGTRLQTVPAGGFMTFELQANENDATNGYTASIQMPNGDTPLNTVRVPAGNGGNDTAGGDRRAKKDDDHLTYRTRRPHSLKRNRNRHGSTGLARNL